MSSKKLSNVIFTISIGGTISGDIEIQLLDDHYNFSPSHPDKIFLR